MRYIIVPGNTDLNRGDQALIWESINLIQEVDINAEIYIIQTGENEEEIKLQSEQTAVRMKAKFISPLIRHPGRGEKEKKEHYYSKFQLLNWGRQALLDLLPRLLLLNRNEFIHKIAGNMVSKSTKETLENIKECDVIIYKGGGYIHSYGSMTDPYIMFYQLIYAMVGRRLNKKVIFLPNSFGPFKNPFARKIVKETLQSLELVTVRENISKKELSSIDINSSFYPDLGFFLNVDDSFDEASYLEKYVDNSNRKKVGITVRPYRFDGHENPSFAYKEYINAFKKFLSYLLQNGYQPILIAQTMGPSKNEDDNEAINLISKGFENEISIISDFNLDASMIKKIYKSMDYVIGTRFHSVIFSLSSLIPSIAVSYGGNKGKGIMQELGLQDYEIEIEDLNEECLIQTFNRLIENEDTYKLNLANKMNEYQNRRTDLKAKLKEVLNL